MWSWDGGPKSKLFRLKVNQDTHDTSLPPRPPVVIPRSSLPTLSSLGLTFQSLADGVRILRTHTRQRPSPGSKILPHPTVALETCAGRQSDAVCKVTWPQSNQRHAQNDFSGLPR